MAHYVHRPQRLGSSVLISADWYETNLGEARTLYSLRHTAIMFRLLYGDIDLLTLARACRTSVEMLDRFYARGLHAEMNIDRIHATRAGVEFAPA
jgi:hypothetical protein